MGRGQVRSTSERQLDSFSGNFSRLFVGVVGTPVLFREYGRYSGLRHSICTIDFHHIRFAPFDLVQDCQSKRA